VRAKPDLIPDCDVHGAPMYRDECRACALGLDDSRDVVVWRCAKKGCSRYFLGTVGYRSCVAAEDCAAPTRRCTREGAFLVVQRALGASICPVEGCTTLHTWHAPDHEPSEEFSAAAR